MNLVSNFYKTEEPLRSLIRNLAANSSALTLDVACKKGDTSESLAEHVGKLIALDKVFFKEWAGQGKNVHFVNGDASCLPFRGERFDTVVACECLQYLEDPLSAIEEIHRILKPGGSLVMSFPEGNASAHFLNPYTLADQVKTLTCQRASSRRVKPVRAEEILRFCERQWKKEVFLRRGTLLFIYSAFILEKLQLLREFAEKKGWLWFGNRILAPSLKIFFFLMKADFSLRLAFMSYNNIIRLRKL